MSGLADSLMGIGSYTFGDTIFTTQTPSTPTAATYEMGMQFQSSAAGQITGIRYYEPYGETGTHTGRIWSGTGTQLASVAFNWETGSGWQTATLGTPLNISANTTYVVSVNINTEGCYTAYGLENAIVNGPLSSLPGVDGNAVWNNTPGAFPNSSNACYCNYFRDIVFTATQCATPSFNPVAGTYNSAQVVTITTATNGATIMYTTDGTIPSSNVGTVYSNPVSITATTTLQAIACLTGVNSSAVASGVYTIACATPTFNPGEGVYTSVQNVTIGTTTSGATIRYTTNGTVPSATVGTIYSSPLAISANSTLQAIAYGAG